MRAVLKAIDGIRWISKGSSLLDWNRCPQPSMHDILHKTDKHGTSWMPTIHEVLGWPPPAEPAAPDPAPLILSPEALEVAKMHDRLPPDVQRKMAEDALMWLKHLGIKP